jgi:hypothetical protein
MQIEPFKCRFDQISADMTCGISCHEFCPYELPGCAGCPYAVRQTPISRSLEDPIKSAVLRGWIRGLSHVAK